MVQCARKLAAHVLADTRVSSPPETTGFNVLQENAQVFSFRHVTKMGDDTERGVRICGATSSLLLLLLLSAVAILSNEVRAASLLEGRQVDAQFWQGVLNKTAEGNMEQAFAMVLGKVSDDLAGAMDRVNEFLDGVRRNVTSVLQEGVKNKAGSPAEETRK
ncbi:uncharacterized protein LOC142581950 [Dermacentor variabilis]|uniref:uncharacterized protein LOC142581950 n=1 Tax=Dermacentor variabilis TaxID=34621 RepID=UPI003F5B75E5